MSKYCYFDVPGHSTEVMLVLRDIASVIRKKNEIQIVSHDGGRQCHTFKTDADAKVIFTTIREELIRDQP